MTLVVTPAKSPETTDNFLSGVGETHRLNVTVKDQPLAAIEDLRRHLLGVVEAVRAVEVDVGFELPLEQDVARADLAEMLTIARRLSVGVCEVLR